MQHQEKWVETKFVLQGGNLHATRDIREVGRGSWFVADILAHEYHHALQTHARGVLLDLGCGKAPLYAAYRNYVDETICIDWKNSHQQLNFLDLEHDLNTPLPLQSATFDTVLLTDVLEHIVRPDLLFSEAARVLRPGGKVIVGVPFLYGIHAQPYDYHRYTEFRLLSFCQDNMLEVLDLHSYGGTLEVLADITAKHVASSAAISQVHLLLSKLITTSSVGRRICKITANKFPLGYVLVAQRHDRT